MKKVEIISKTHMRDRILTYFQLLHEEQGCQNEHIFIPYNRTELSKYLCVNRSAMVRELGKLKVEGILDYADIHSVILKNIKNQFK